MGDDGHLPPDDVDALLAGKLDATAAKRAEAHIDACAECRVLVGQMAKDSAYGAKSLAQSDAISAGEQVSATDETVRERPSETRVDRRSRPSGAIPQQIDRYVIEKKLGAGGMGVVFLAEDAELKRKVVIKLLRSEMLEASASDRSRLLREAQAMAKVSHPNVVPIYDVGVHDDQVFLAMEFIDGQDLAGWLETKHEADDVLAVFVAAGRGLAAAHRAGLVHRDFKPHNVMIAKTGEVKVTDFGLARAELIEEVAREVAREKRPRLRGSVRDLGASTLLDSPLTHTGAVVGTPAYMAPEQIHAEAVDARTDQFSFCVALYEGLYGERPFRGKTVDELFDSTLGGKPILRAARGVPARVRAAIRRGLSVEPADRFPTMDALLGQLAPPPRSRVALVALAGVLAIGAGGVAFALARDEKLCTGGATALQPVWNSDRARAIETAFATANQSFGPKAYGVVGAALDRYAQSWIAVHEDACADTRVRGDQTEADMDRRMQCLRRRSNELDAMLAVLAKPDEDMLVNAPSMIASLPSPETCNDANATDPLIADPKLRASVEELEKELAAIEARAAATRFEEAEQRMAEVLPRAEKLEYLPLLAEATLAAGTLKEVQLEHAAAQKLFDGTVELAEKASADRVRAAAYIRLISVARAQSNLDEADRWIRYATAAVERLGDRELHAYLDRAAAEVERTRGNNEAAAKIYARAIDRMTQAKGADSRDVAMVQQELAMHYSGIRDWETAYEQFEVARETYAKAAGPGTPDSAAVMGQMAALRHNQGRFEEAVTLGARMLEEMEAYFGADHPQVIDSYPLHAIRLQSVGKNAEAIALMQKTVGLARETYGMGVKLGTTLSMAGLLYGQLDERDESYAAFDEGLSVYVKVFGGEANAEAIVALNAMAAIRRRQERYDDALALLERSRVAAEKFQGPSGPVMAEVLTRTGTVHIHRKRFDDAIAALERALTMYAANKAGPSELAWVELELAKAYDGAKQRSRAIALAKEAAAHATDAGDRGTLDEVTAWLAERR